MEKRGIFCPMGNHPQSNGLCTGHKCRWWRIPADCCVIEEIIDIFSNIHIELELLRTQR